MPTTSDRPKQFASKMHGITRTNDGKPNRVNLTKASLLVSRYLAQRGFSIDNYKK